MVLKSKTADKVFIFTDCRLWDSDYNIYGSYGKRSTLKDEWNKYKKVAPNAKLYIFDLGGYGNVSMI
jgi:hypothetical protein